MNRFEWILGILLVVLLVVIAVLSLVFWFGPQIAVGRPDNTATVIAQRAAAPAPTSIFTGKTAKIAYAQAQQTAVTWQADAKLLNTTATWPQGASPQELQEGEATWGFTFYSPAAGEIALISVIEDNANLVSQGGHQQNNPVLEASGWNLDSNDVLDMFLLEGGNQFLGSEGLATLSMQLKADDKEQNGRMEWEVNMIALQNGRALQMRIDATSGEILENRTVP